MDDGSWLEVDMVKGEGDMYTGSIPKQPFGSVIDYYITASSKTGKTSSFGADADSTYDRFGVWREEDMVLKLSFEEDDLNFIDSTDYAHNLNKLGDWVVWDDPDDQVEGNFCAYLPEGSDAIGEILSPFLSMEEYTISVWVRPEPDTMRHNIYIISNGAAKYTDSFVTTDDSQWWMTNYTLLHRNNLLRNDVVHDNREPSEFPWHGDRSFVKLDTLGKWSHYLINCGPDSLVVQRNDENDNPVERTVYKGPLGNGWKNPFKPLTPSRGRFRIGSPSNDLNATPPFSGYLDRIEVYNYQTLPGNFAQAPTNVEYITAEVPERFELYNNYPNPFNPETTIRYQLAKHSDVKIEIYNVLGQKIRTLLDVARPAGLYTIQWDAKNDNGAFVASGVYIYRMEATDFVKSEKMLLLK
jgi:hypothetical protein